MGLHLLGEPVDLATGVAVDDGLGDGKSSVQIAKGLKLPLLALNGDVELLDTLKGELVLLHKDADRIAHELGSNLQDLKRHGGTEDAALHSLWHVLEDIVDLVLESSGKHLIGLVQHEHLHGLEAQSTSLDHVVHTAGGSHHHVHALLKSADVISHGSSSHTGMDGDVHEVSEGGDDLDDLLRELSGGSKHETLALLHLHVKGLQDADGEGGGLSGSGLRLRDHVSAGEGGLHGALLDGRGLFEPIGVDASEQVLLEVHVVERGHHLGPVGLHAVRLLGARVGVGRLHLLRHRVVFVVKF